MSYTVIHATHEAVRKAGGIGAVLEGLMTSSVYREAVRRSFLVGPLLRPEDEDLLAESGEVLFSTISGVQNADCADALNRVAERYNVNIVYGIRRFGGGYGADVLLVDAEDINPRRSRNFKYNLYRHFGLASDRYDTIADYALYIDSAEAIYDAVVALIGKDPSPHIVLAHEYMGMPVALKTIMENDPRFRAIFYAHEVSAMREITEGNPGHDVMFYNAMARALAQGEVVEDIFGDQSDYYRHALVQLASHCDGIFAVGDPTLDELRFMGLEAQAIDLVYNGIPAVQISYAEKLQSRSRLQEYAQNLLGYEPDVVMTHVTRPVISKGLWRDLLVLTHLDKLLGNKGQTGVFFVLTTAAEQRSARDIEIMESEYGWPVVHHKGPPDLVSNEVDIWRDMVGFNRESVAIQAILVNQFGWDQASCGQRMPQDMTFEDLRRGTDVEFGQSIYEPFGIAVLEPLTFGGLCVPSSVCGCCGFLGRVTKEQADPLVIVADYTADVALESAASARVIGEYERRIQEGKVAEKVAWDIADALPSSDREREARLHSGYRLAGQMSWDRVCEAFFLPGIERAISRGRVQRNV
ncbi:MAG: hypothetical protein F4Y39_14605 [Gemmatimonadetes bacterium]|nr:hypothetical protein [Gemmatimonadota bacterium]MYF72651.1 hypothetical protein [Gemmatimonadota bacterium]MYK52835.1 hypothetical protein [Gemmatimonadota bacterium]